MNRRSQRRRPQSDDTVPILLAEEALNKVLKSNVLKEIEDGSAGAISIIVPSVGWVDSVGNIMGGHAPDAWVMERPTRPRNPEDDNTTAANQLAEGKLVIVVTVSDQLVPPVIRTVRTYDLVVPPLDAPMVASVIKKVAVGRLPPGFNRLPLQTLGFEEIAAAVGLGGDAHTIATRLEKAVVRKAEDASAGNDRVPDLAVAVEYGAARDFAIDLKIDLDDVRAGRLSIDEVDLGCLLTSVPGCGKSLYSKALGKFLGVPVVQSSVADWFAAGPGYLDSVVKAMRKTFEEAREKAPCVLFLDECDALPDLDQTRSHGRDWWAPVVLDFLTLLDSATSNRAGVIVVAATNREHMVAPAIKRPGRLERVLHIGPPNAVGAERVLRFHLMRDLEHEDIGDIARICADASKTPADMMEAVRAARRTARRAGRNMIHADLLGRFRRPETRSEEQIRVVATHEAGHALAAALLLPERLVFVSIEPNGADSGGRLRLAMHDDFYVPDREKHLDWARIFLGGRAAESILLNGVTVGSGGNKNSDIALASAQIAALHLSFGHGSALRWRCEPDDALSLLHRHPSIQVEVEKELARCHGEVVSLLERNRAALERMVSELLTRRTLDAEEIRRVAGVTLHETGPATTAPAPLGGASLSGLASTKSEPTDSSEGSFGDQSGVGNSEIWAQAAAEKPVVKSSATA